MKFSARKLESAAQAAVARGDLEAAVDAYLAVASDPSIPVAERVRLGERVGVLARHVLEPARVEPALVATLEEPLDAHQRGRLEFARHLVLSYAGRDQREVTRALLEARARFADAGDDAMTARALGALAIPRDDSLTVDERIAFGREGLALASRAGDATSFAHCAGNLAVALSSAGETEAFELWERAVASLDADGSPEARDDALRYRSVWAVSALAWGRYDDARRLIRDGSTRTRHPFWSARYASHEAVLLWRTGQWDDALVAADRAKAGRAQRAIGPAPAIEAAIAFERSARGGAAVAVPVEDAVERNLSLIVLSATIAARVRARRREPAPERGLHPLVGYVARTRARVGWEELLPVAAEIDDDLYQTFRSSIEHLRPAGWRAQPSLLAAEAVVAARDRAAGAAEQLLAAADAYEALGEPHPAARMRMLAADALVAQGRRAAAIRAQARDSFSVLGAERSMAELVRRARRSTALAGTRVPDSQRYAPSPGLTRRERDVAELAVRAYTAAEIAARLGISVATARTHLASIKRKLGARRKADLVRLLQED